MSIRYACKNMGLNCNFSVKGQTTKEVTTKALDHIRMYHADDFNIIESPEQIKKMEEALERSMREVAS